MVVVRKLLQHVLPPLLLLKFVDSRGHERNKTAPPHAGPAWHDGGGEGGAGVVNELARGIEALAAMTEEAWCVGLGVEIEEEGPKHDSQTAVEHVKTVLQLNCTENKRVNRMYIQCTKAGDLGQQNALCFRAFCIQSREGGPRGSYR